MELILAAGIPFGAGLLVARTHTPWWILPAVFGFIAAALLGWFWIEVETYRCVDCDRGMGEAIAALLTVGAVMAWTVGTGIYAAGYAVGHALTTNGQTPAANS